MSSSSVREMVRVLIGCKWSLRIFTCIRAGTNRPGALVREIDGLSTKVLNDCLRRHISYGILHKRAFPEVPPRVEYEITDFGRRFVSLLDSIEALEQSVSGDAAVAELDGEE